MNGKKRSFLHIYNSRILRKLRQIENKNIVAYMHIYIYIYIYIYILLNEMRCVPLTSYSCFTDLINMKFHEEMTLILT